VRGNVHTKEGLALERPSPEEEGRLRRAQRAILALLPFVERWAHGRLPQRARRRMETGDLVQETLVHVLRNLGELDTADPQRLRNYLIAAIRNQVRDEIRRAELGEVRNGALADGPDPDPGPLHRTIESEERRQFRAALVGLPEADRDLLVGRIELGLPYEELALATGLPSAAAARMATKRASLRLARLLGQVQGPARS
jgi:RNA polymerase sigma-70 factor (ECF subfamily)